MRRRPDLKVMLSPGRPLAGAEFTAEIVMNSRAETPCDRLELRLVGEERRYLYSTGVNPSTPVYANNTIVSLGASLEGFKLTVGEHRRRVRFALPVGAPPAYSSKLSRVEYALDVRVVIPWWPDRHERYTVPVTTDARLGDVAPHHGAYCTHAGGPRAGELYLEASLERNEIEVGGLLRGAVSIANVASARLRRVEGSLVAYETPRVASSVAKTEVARYTAKLRDGAPREAESLPFSIRLPDKVPPAFASAFFQVTWGLELRAVVAFGTDVTLTIPISVVTRPAERDLAAPTPRVAPVGRDRRALVWAAAARACGFESDDRDDRERMSATFGSVAAEIEVEQRSEGAWTIAHLRWPDLGIDLHVTERRWLDAVRGAVKLEVEAFDRRFTVRAREAEQARAFLVPLADAFVPFLEVAIDDEGCVVAVPGGGFSVESLSRFLEWGKHLAGAADRVAAEIPAPSALADRAAAWRTFAEEIGGRFVPGSCSIERATIDGVRFEVSSRWDDEAHLGWSLSFDLGGHLLPAGIDLQEIVGNHWRQSEGALVIDLDRVDDPHELASTVRSLAPIVRAARGEREGGPYR